MATRTTGDPSVDGLYKVRRGRVEFVDVPELGFAMVDGAGAPGGGAFSGAIQALYAASYGAHFALRKAAGEAPRVMALEALWWVEGVEGVEGVEARATMELMAAGVGESDPSRWRWRAMIMQLPPIDGALIAEAVDQARAKRSSPALDALRYERWAEGPSAQIMHVGPYATEQVSILALHRAIAEHGSRPWGRHHEIYLGDPRTAAPEKLRTILRQPIQG